MVVCRASAAGARPQALWGADNDIPRVEDQGENRRRRKRLKGKLGGDFEQDLLEAAMARTREEEDEFLQAVSQDETMKELVCLPLQCAACFSDEELPFFFAQS